MSNRPERFAPGSRLFVGDRELVVAVVARRAGSGWVVQFAGVDDRNAAEALRGKIVRGRRRSPTRPTASCGCTS